MTAVAELRPGGLALTKRALDLCTLPEGAIVLDLGCGPGATVAHLRDGQDVRAIGVDRDAARLRRVAAARPAVPLVRASGVELPFADGSVAAVLLECSLSVMGAVGHVLAECRRVLAPGGRLALTDLYARDEAGLEQARRALPGLLSLPGLIAALTRAGFTVRVGEDHTRALTTLLARLVLDEGSIAPFWELACAGCGDARDADKALRRVRPGYLLVIAQKEIDHAR